MTWGERVKHPVPAAVRGCHTAGSGPTSLSLQVQTQSVGIMHVTQSHVHTLSANTCILAENTCIFGHIQTHIYTFYFASLWDNLA